MRRDGGRVLQKYLRLGHRYNFKRSRDDELVRDRIESRGAFFTGVGMH